MELASGVVSLRPEDAMFEAMLSGWRAQQAARGEEQRVLGYIAYFGDANKSQLFAALEQSGLAPALAHNIAERLALVGLVQDTGHHYIVPDRELAGVAASLVEADIIALLDRGQ